MGLAERLRVREKLIVGEMLLKIIKIEATKEMMGLYSVHIEQHGKS